MVGREFRKDLCRSCSVKKTMSWKMVCVDTSLALYFSLSLSPLFVRDILSFIHSPPLWVLLFTVLCFHPMIFEPGKDIREIESKYFGKILVQSNSNALFSWKALFLLRFSYFSFFPFSFFIVSFLERARNRKRHFNHWEFAIFVPSSPGNTLILITSTESFHQLVE